MSSTQAVTYSRPWSGNPKGGMQLGPWSLVLPAFGTPLGWTTVVALTVGCLVACLRLAVRSKPISDPRLRFAPTEDLTTADASLLSDEVKARGCAAIDQLRAIVMSAFEHPDEASADGAEFVQLLVNMGLEHMKESLLDVRDCDKLKPFVTEICDHIKMNPILVVLAAELAANSDWVEQLPEPSDKRNREVRRAVAHCYLLNSLASVITREPEGIDTTFSRVAAVFTEKRTRLKWHRHMRLFEIFKIYSCDKPASNALMQKRGERPKVGALLPLNILEAMCQDAANGFGYNSDAGFELAAEPNNQRPIRGLANDLSLPGTGKYSRCGVLTHRPPLPREWANLYSSWNMAFGVNNGWGLMFLAKLLNPSTLGVYQHDDAGLYLHFRFLCLWVHLHWTVFARVSGEYNQSEGCDWRSEVLSVLWGKVNLEAAKQYRARIDSMMAHHGEASGVRRTKRAIKWGAWKLIQACARTVAQASGFLFSVFPK